MAHTAAPCAPVPSHFATGRSRIAVVRGLAMAPAAARVSCACPAVSDTAPDDGMTNPLRLGVRLHRCPA